MIKKFLIIGISGFLVVSCNDRNNETDSDKSDTSVKLTDTRRNTPDTSNFLTDTTGNNRVDTSRSQ